MSRDAYDPSKDETLGQPQSEARPQKKPMKIDWKSAARLWAEGSKPGAIAAQLGIEEERIWRHLKRSARFRFYLSREIERLDGEDWRWLAERTVAAEAATPIAPPARPSAPSGSAAARWSMRWPKPAARRQAAEAEARARIEARSEAEVRAEAEAKAVAAVQAPVQAPVQAAAVGRLPSRADSDGPQPSPAGSSGPQRSEIDPRVHRIPAAWTPPVQRPGEPPPSRAAKAARPSPSRPTDNCSSDGRIGTSSRSFDTSMPT